MITIAICDDEKIHLALAKKQVDNYFSKKDIPYQVDLYPSGTAFLDKDEQYDIVFMDIELDNEPDGNTDYANGLDVLMRYKESHASYLILFTSHKDEVLNGYKVDADRFLYKPIEIPVLREALDNALTELIGIKAILGEINGVTYQIPVKNIQYIEAGHQVVYARTAKDLYPIRCSMQEIWEKLNPIQFFRPHRSYIINLKYFVSHTDTEIRLSNADQTRIGLNHSRIRALEDALLTYSEKRFM